MRRSDYDEALLLDESGNIAEGSGENLFLDHGGRLLTNDERSSILLGITRDSMIEIARDLCCEVEIGTLTLEGLRSTDEAFFTGTPNFRLKAEVRTSAFARTRWS